MTINIDGHLMRNMPVTYLTLVLLISTSIVLLLFVTKQGTSVSAATAGEFKLNPNAKRFHSNISCDDFADMIRSTNGANTATIVLDMNTYQIQPSWFATFGDDGQDFYKNSCANNNGSTTITSNNNLSSIQLKTGRDFKLHYNIIHFEDSSIYLANNTDSDEHIIRTNEQRLIVDQFKKLTTARDGDNGIHDFEFRIDSKHKVGAFKLVIIEGINDEAASYHIVKKCKDIMIYTDNK
jgi:hypothetical protein